MVALRSQGNWRWEAENCVSPKWPQDWPCPCFCERAANGTSSEQAFCKLGRVMGRS